MTPSDYDARQARRRGLLLLFVVLLAVLGAADGTYLSLVHIDYELGKPSDLAEVCSKLARQGCVVTTGRFGSLLGIPVSLWGLAGAAATAVVAAVAWRHRGQHHDPWRGTTFGLAAISVLASLAMAAFSALEGSYCPFCVIWYGINLGLGVAAWMALGDDQDASLGRLFRDTIGPPGAVALVVFLASFSTAYWLYADRHARTRAELETVMDLMVQQRLTEPAVEIDLTGLPSRGPEDATLTIVEVADFQCPFCRRLWQSVHDYGEHSTFSVRTAFVHYPLDGKCNPGMEEIHPHACLAARAAECARRDGKFWEYGDLMFAYQHALERNDLLAHATELGLDQAAFSACLDDPKIELEVRRSIARAILLGVDAPPTFFVNGRKFRGALHKAWMPIVLDKFARAAKQGDTGAPSPTPASQPE
ncbi:thioredoxin domain-containing protein [Paraliomyxa miuraensis]|uniref:thioredoxin domain-containing protein n=1 Tax=Paraliomyxa miuraensis TaxID=376150 RepID=UPI00225ADF03|nr:thioredoxin domain-containing protein [Paraliomyxa miuraensis]MCX4245119.1 thioredoxin domain-containing protein [Paraliomyxa miuraensis]